MMGMEITTTGVMGFAIRINSFEDENNINNWEKNTVSYFMKRLNLKLWLDHIHLDFFFCFNGLVIPEVGFSFNPIQIILK